MGDIINIAAIMIACNAVFGFFYLGMHRRGIGYITGFLRTTVYFLTIAALTALCFWPTLVRVLLPVSSTPLITLGVVMIAQAFIYSYLPRVVPAPTSYFARFPDRYYLQLDWRRLISKSADILAQQIFIVLLVLFLHDLGLSILGVTVWFFVLFSLLHIPLIANERGAWPSWLFAGAVVGFSLTFPLLILKIPYGFAYTYAIHWMFYTVTATAFWLSYARAHAVAKEKSPPQVVAATERTRTRDA